MCAQEAPCERSRAEYSGLGPAWGPRARAASLTALCWEGQGVPREQPRASCVTPSARAEAALSAGDLAEALGAGAAAPATASAHSVPEAALPRGAPGASAPRGRARGRPGHHRGRARGGSAADREASAGRPEPEGEGAGVGACPSEGACLPGRGRVPAAGRLGACLPGRGRARLRGRVCRAGGVSRPRGVWGGRGRPSRAGNARVGAAGRCQLRGRGWGRGAAPAGTPGRRGEAGTPAGAPRDGGPSGVGSAGRSSGSGISSIFRETRGLAPDPGGFVPRSASSPGWARHEARGRPRPAPELPLPGAVLPGRRARVPHEVSPEPRSACGGSGLAQGGVRVGARGRGPRRARGRRRGGVRAGPGVGVGAGVRAGAGVRVGAGSGSGQESASGPGSASRLGSGPGPAGRRSGARLGWTRRCFLFAASAPALSPPLASSPAAPLGWGARVESLASL